MSALNSYSVTERDFNLPSGMVEFVTSERVFARKGLFIIPYQPLRIVVSVRVTCKVIATPNESLNVWSNPEIGFYGYAHIRSFKKTLGSPVQFNQRSHIVYMWFSEALVSVIATARSHARLAGLVAEDPDLIDWHLPGPEASDLSFGFAREGRYEVSCEIGYLSPLFLLTNPTGPLLQSIPDAGQVAAIDPRIDRQLGDPETPVSPPYDPSGLDFGESELGEEESPDPIPDGSTVRLLGASYYINPQNGIRQDIIIDTGCTLTSPVTVNGPPFAVQGAGIFFSVTQPSGTSDIRVITSAENPAQLQEMVVNTTWSIVVCPET